ncbi:response regulator [Anaeromyxobacter oryzae]|uniref:Response regulator n=1 Tax=Anaeromyxobacter oryzae TaxID=2918170 RepID=A0ABM7WNP7_9BACT|nr:response regulator [Anaeromyxobacter oryzae]BDG01089.1 response regulator [Anaeromyxobacter oryzae]
MKRILLVDDSRVTRELMKVYLIARDVTLLEAADGAEALAKAKADPPDLILADLRMPRLDGVALCEALRADLRTRGVPVVILTSDRDAETVLRARAAGAREVLQKPIQPQPLLDAINRHLAPDAARP